MTIALLLSLASVQEVAAQVGVGFVFGGDWYQWYQNPERASEEALPASGNAVLNLIIGPKVWFGGERFSLSLEGCVNWGATAFDMHEYKGMGAMAFPLLAKLNFGTLSGFSNGGGKGFYLGGGMQYSRTELYGTTAEFRDNTTRQFFRTWVGEIGFGSGMDNFTSSNFVRIGIGENKAFTLNIGSILDFDIKGFAKTLKEDNPMKRDRKQIQSFL